MGGTIFGEAVDVEVIVHIEVNAAEICTMCESSV